MRPNLYKVLEMAVEEGVNYGYNRAHKHNDNPTEAEIKMQVTDSVMTSICEWFNFEGE